LVAVVFNSTPVAKFRAVTVAPGKAAPVGSVTTPRMPPVALWARADDEKLNNAATAISAATALDLILGVSNIISYPS
jgi:hypothetical protein